MVRYDPHKWFEHFFDIRGSMVREISVRVALCVAWSVLVVYAYRSGLKSIAIPSTLHSLVGVALGLLLVFRTNSAYDRFWEGRKLWGGMVNETRNLIRLAVCHLPGGEVDLVQSIARLTAAFPYLSMATLRGDTELAKLVGFLRPDEMEAVARAQHPALQAATRITSLLVDAHRRNVLSDINLQAIDQNVQLLVDYLGGCERIRKTPLPFAYVVHLRRALVMYCFTLPFALVDTFGWATVLDVLLISYIFFGIEEIGVEIEGPFGYDDNDLPLEEICRTIQTNVFALAELGPTAREAMPEGL